MRKITALLTVLAILCAAGCTPQAAQPPVVLPYEVALTLPEPTSTPEPRQMPTPTPTPTVEPTPTPTPDPFAGLTRVSNPADSRFFYVPVNDAVRERIVGTSYPEDPGKAPVAIEDLRYVHIRYRDFDGVEHEGELLVHQLVADDVMSIFYGLYQAEYPLASVRLVDDFGEAFNDNLSMSANNSSAYCCRRVTGSNAFSLHAYGFAIDINPVQNPYVNGRKVSPPEAAAYADRTPVRPGMITEDDVCYRLFTSLGWSWGGDFKGDPDYQHFSKDLRDEL